jgi:hypothetical protein
MICLYHSCYLIIDIIVCNDQRDNLQKSSINAVISRNNRNNVGFVCVLIIPYKVMTNIRHILYVSFTLKISFDHNVFFGLA